MDASLAITNTRNDIKIGSKQVDFVKRRNFGFKKN